MPRVTTAEPSRGRSGSPTILLVGLLATLLGCLSYGRLSSDLFARYSLSLHRVGDLQGSTVAALRAVGSAPWSSDGYRAQAHARDPAGESRAPVVAAALRWAPSDPYLWAEMGSVLARENHFGKAYTATLRNIDELAPNSPQLHRLRVQAGLDHWHRGDAAAREYWLESMRFRLETAPQRFVRQLRQQGDVQRFCWTAGTRLDLDAWCDAQLRR